MDQLQMKKRAVFFARVKSPTVLERNEFYAVDLRILRELGWDVILALKPWSIPAADLYFVWWWTWALFPVLRARLAGKPVIVVGVFDHVMADGSLEVFYRRNVVHRWMHRESLRWANANVFCSKLELNRMVSEFEVNRPVCSHCAVDSEIYHSGSRPREKFILSFCWMNHANSKRKCVAESIRAMALLHDRYPDYQFLICGEKLEGHTALAALVHELNAEKYISFPGVVSREEKISLMQRCVLYLQPTLVEGFGLAIAEAMACGAPVVTSPVGTVPEVVGDAAVMVSGTDPAAIAEGVAGLLQDEALQEALSQRGRQRIVDEFTYAKRKAELGAIIQTLTQR